MTRIAITLAAIATLTTSAYAADPLVGIPPQCRMGAEIALNQGGYVAPLPRIPVRWENNEPTIIDSKGTAHAVGVPGKDVTSNTPMHEGGALIVIELKPQGLGAHLAALSYAAIHGGACQYMGLTMLKPEHKVFAPINWDGKEPSYD